jgi:glycogen synthase
MTRVLHVLDHSLPLHSGYTFRTRAIMKAQQAQGLDVRGVTGHRHIAAGDNPEVAEGLIFYRTGGQANGPVGIREWREIGQLASAIDKVCEEWQPDILHAHSPALCGAAALRVSKRLGIPLVYEIRAFWEDAAVGNLTSKAGSVRYLLTRTLENQVVAGANAIVTICEGLRSDLIERGTDASRISIMPNGVDMGLFGTPLAPDPALARKLGLGDGPVIGFIGSFYDYEGIDDLIAAMPILLRSNPDARLLLVGGGPRDSALKQQAEASTASSAIRFTGRVPHDEVERYYALMDVMAYPRKRSRLTDLVTPLKPLEAMAQGKLVAASDVGGHRELIVDGVTGTLFTPDNPVACAKALSALLNSKAMWEDRRATARIYVETRHDWSINVQRYQDVYQKLIPASNLHSFQAASHRS